MERHEDQDASPPAIVVKDLCKSFDDHEVLRGIDLTIRHGEIVAIVGGSGSGKTVLLDLIVGLLTPDRGQVFIANHGGTSRRATSPGATSPGATSPGASKRGPADAPLVDLTTATDAELDGIRRHWAIVFQHNALFSGTVFENIALWLEEVGGLTTAQIRPRVESVVAAVGLEPARVLDEDREELSGGMAKRVAIARALAMDPAMIFYDEPTTGLDPSQAGRIQELISATHWRPTDSGDTRTSLIITHDKDLLRRLAPRIIMLHDGHVLFDGPYADFVASDSKVIRPYVDMMAVLHTHGTRT